MFELSKIAVGVVLAAAGSVALAAVPAPLTAVQVLQQFNLVVLDDMSTSSEVEGRTWIGGNLTGNLANSAYSSSPASTYAGLTVMGNLGVGGGFNAKGGIAVGGNAANGNVNEGGGVVLGNSTNVNFNGSVPSYVAGTRTGNANSGTVNLLSDNATLQSYADSMNSTNFSAVMGGASDTLAGLAANSSTTQSGGKLIFNAAPVDGVAVFDVDGFAGISEFEFNLGSATSVFINSSFSGSLSVNFLGGSAPLIGKKVVWNFHDANTLTLTNQWGGSVLATDAAVTTGNNIEGALIAKSFTQGGEMHLQSYIGNIPAVPEPSTYALMALGLVAVGAVARRRAAQR